MVDETLVFVFEDDIVVGEDLCDMISAQDGIACRVFSKFSDLVRSQRQGDRQPDAIFAVYDPEALEVEAHLTQATVQGIRVVLINGAAAEARVAGSGNWLHLQKPFTQEDVFEMVKEVFTDRLKA